MTVEIRPITDAAFLRQGLAIGPAFEFPSVSACGAMVGAGLGIAALPALALDLVAMPGLASVPLVRPRVSRPVGIVTRIGRTLPPVSGGFLSLLAEHGVPPNPGLKRR